MKLFLQTLFIFIAVLSSKNLKSQTYFQSNDSLLGFDEQLFIQNNVAQGISGAKLKLEMHIAKKEFIFSKYHINANKGFGAFPLTTSTPTLIQPSCTNMGFESGDFTGWEEANGINTNALTMAGCCNSLGAINSAVINTGGFDPNVGGTILPLISPFVGTKIARINDDNSGARVDRITQSFSVTPTNAVLQIAFAAVLNSVPGNFGCHRCLEQPYINISLIDSAGIVLACPNLNFSAPSCSCAAVGTGWVSYGSGSYKPWTTQTVDLSPYIGQYVTLQVTVGDCSLTGHYGYAYFDCQCLPIVTTLNGLTYDSSPLVPVSISSCGSANSIITAPEGLGPYIWDGPLGSGITGVTTQTFATTTTGQYTVTLQPAGSCAPGGKTFRYVDLFVTPNPTVTSLATQATCTNAVGTGEIFVNSGTPGFIYNWNPPASNGPLATALLPGTNYTIEVIDLYGCRGTTTLSIASFTDAPTYTVTPLNGLLTCNTTTLSLSALPLGINTVGGWSPVFTSTFVASTSGTYSAVFTNTNSLCTSTVPVIVTQNIIAPVATPIVACNGATVSLNASAGIGIALGWLAPTNPITSLPSISTSTAFGTYTLTATNFSTGCKTAYLVPIVVPTATISVTPQMSLTCVSKTLQAVAITTPTAGITTSWLNGITTNTVSPYFISTPGTYTATVLHSGGCSSRTTFTVTENTSVDVDVTSTSTVIPCLTNSLTLNAISLLGGPYSYIWSAPTASGDTYSASNAGTYTVIATNSINGCTAVATYVVSKENILGSTSFNASVYQGLMPLPVSFTNTSTNANNTDYTWLWDFGNSLTDTSPLTTATIYNTQGDYNVVLYATKGFCSDTTKKLIKVELVSDLKIPNVFTPNGDGKNDLFSLIALNMAEIEMTIFDRWGLKIFEGKETGKIAWDGKTKGGSLANDGTYFYIVLATGLDGIKYDFKGFLTLFR